MRCDFADSLLQCYFDGELSALSAAEFERHLQHCVDCAVELVDLDLLSGRLQLAQLYEAAPASLRKLFLLNMALYALWAPSGFIFCASIDRSRSPSRPSF